VGTAFNERPDRELDIRPGPKCDQPSPPFLSRCRALKGIGLASFKKACYSGTSLNNIRAVRDFRSPEGIFRPRKSYAHRQSRKGTPPSELDPGWIRGRAAWISLRCDSWRPWIVLRTAAR